VVDLKKDFSKINSKEMFDALKNVHGDNKSRGKIIITNARILMS